MKKYEYSMKNLVGAELETELNTYGIAGWRLVSLTYIEPGLFLIVMEREVPDFTYAP